MISDRFTNDSVRQLHCGLKVMAFKEEHAKKIVFEAKKRYNLDVTYKKVDYYYVLTPAEKQVKHISY